MQQAGRTQRRCPSARVPPTARSPLTSPPWASSSALPRPPRPPCCRQLEARRHHPGADARFDHCADAAVRGRGAGAAAVRGQPRCGWVPSPAPCLYVAGTLTWQPSQRNEVLCIEFYSGPCSSPLCPLLRNSNSSTRSGRTFEWLGVNPAHSSPVDDALGAGYMRAVRNLYEGLCPEVSA